MDEKELKEDEALEQLLDILEDPSSITREELDGLSNNKEAIGMLKDITDCKDAVRQESAFLVPDVDTEWNRFYAKHSVHRFSNRFVWGGIIGMAASFLLIFLFSWFGKIYQKDGITVCTASHNAQQITLRTSTGQNISINNNLGAGTLKALGTTLSHRKDTLELKYAKTARKVEIHVLSTPRGQDFKLQLADGTIVWLNSETRIEYPTVFVGKERVVRLYGEAYFKVAHDKRHPFIVQAGNMQTRVLGTEFNICSYQGVDSHVTLIEGSVEVKSSKNRDFTRIKPGEDALVKSNGTIRVKDVDVDAITYWKDGFFYFDNVPFVDIMQSLGRWYNVNVVFKNEKVLNYRLRYLCDRKSGLEYALKLLNKMNNISVKLESNTIIIQ
ncbi:MAG: DUF4974 domain-containing protein [Bacteroidales bacterium]|nr:DUF4974 domain-containing protein [Bacteroidales bacterium]